MRTFPMYLNGISIPALGFATDPHHCGDIWCVASNGSQPHGGRLPILSIQLPVKINIVNICHLPDTDQYEGSDLNYQT